MKATRGFRRGLLAALMTAIPHLPAHAQTCTEPKTEDFKVSTLITSGGLDWPVHLAVAPDARVFIAEMNAGEIRLYKPGSSGTTLAGKVPSAYNNEDGLLGISLHPRFAQNGFLFAFFTAQTGSAHVLIRYKVNGDAVDIASGVEVLRIPRMSGGHTHAAGGLAWDSQENLIISTGDDTSPNSNGGYAAVAADIANDARKSASNTNDLRGKILRIHPENSPVDGKYYTIPEGNLFPAGTALTRPEIYAMGARNPYRVSVHPSTGWIFFGEVGPDAAGNNASLGRMGHDEINIVPTPGNYGWPYCNGNNFAYNDVTASGAPVFDCAKPVNNSPNNTGLRELPPSRPPAIWYTSGSSTDWPEMRGVGGRETAMVGPVYAYDKANPSKSKFPPQYHGRLLFWDWARRIVRLGTLDGQAKLKSTTAFPVAGSTFGSLISAEYGKDGSLYLLRFSTEGYSGRGSSGGLYRVEYTGAIETACEATVSLTRPQDPAHPARMTGGMAGISVFELPENASGIEVFNLKGRRVWSETRNGRTGRLRLEMPPHLADGVVRARMLE